MAYEAQQMTHTFVAGEDLSSSQYEKVYVGSNGLIFNDDTGGRRFIGILQDNPASGVVGNVCVLGISKLKVAGSTTTASLVTGSANQTVGVVLAGTGGAGVATVLITGIDTDTTA